jgi:hypothetical protein
MAAVAGTGSRLHRVVWFVALWLGGVVTVGAVAYLLRALVRAAAGGG